MATHSRSLHKYTEDLQLDHYLEVLTRKPGALAGATALAHARAALSRMAGPARPSTATVGVVTCAATNRT